MSRINPYIKHPKLVKPLLDFSAAVKGYGLEKSLVELVQIRASQINGCALCLDMHAREARKEGETEERVLMLSAWRETTLYSKREQAALAWTEALTRIADGGPPPDEVHAAVQAEFNEEEEVALTMLVGVINAFNRIGVAYRLPPLSQQRKAT